MKMLTSLVFALTVMFSAVAAHAGFLQDLGQFVSTFGTAHEQDGYRDTGCDPAFQVQITNDAGEYLYSNNPTCPMVGGPSDDLSPAPVAVEEPEEDPVESCKGECDLASAVE